MKFCIALLACIAISFFSFSQAIPKNPNVTDAKGLRQGKWTLLFDTNWNPVTEKSKAVYYRLIEYENDKPTGVVRDYYPSGKVQWQGKLLADRPKEVNDGEAIWFRETGTKEMMKFFEKGNIIKEVNFDEKGNEIIETAETLNAKGEQAYQAGQYDQAISYFSQSLKFTELQDGKDNAMYATALNNLGYMFLTKGNFSVADSLYHETLEIRERVLGKNHQDYGSTLYSLGELNAFSGKLHDAEALYNQAVEIYKNTIEIDDEYYVLAYNNLGVLYSEMGRYDEAIRYLESVVDSRARVKGNETMEYAQAINNLSDVYSRVGEYRKAEKLCREALRIREKVLGTNHPYVAHSLNNLATLYFNESRYTQAEEMYLRAINIYGTSVGKDNTDYAQFICNLAVLYAEVNLPAKAEPLFKDALVIFEKFVGKEHQIYALCLNEMARMCFFQGKLAQAETLYVEALEIRGRILGKTHPYYAVSLGGLANVYNAKGDYPRAEAFYKEVHEIYSLIFGKDNPFFTGSLDRLASVYINMKDEANAYKTFKDVNLGYLGQIRNYFPGLSEKERESFYAEVRNRFEIFNSFAVDNSKLYEDVYNNQLEVKALLFNTNNKIRNAILKSGDTTLISEYQHWQARRDELVIAYKMSIEERQKDSINITSIEAEINTLERKLSERSLAFDKMENKGPEITWNNIRKNLNSGEAAMEIIRFHKYGFKKLVVDSSDVALKKYPRYDLNDTVFYAAFIITKNSKNPELILFKNGNELEGRLIRNYKNNIHFQQNDTISYSAYWRPVAKYLDKKKIKTVYVSPDGVYNQINLSTLKNSATQKFVIDEIDLKLLTNTRDIINMPKSRRISSLKAISFFGYPDYSNGEITSIDFNEERDINAKVAQDTTQRFLIDGRITELPGTQAETNAIYKLLTENNIAAIQYIEGRASESEIKQLKNPGILHIATHGFFLESKNTDFAGFKAQQLAQNPLLRSGLLMAGSQSAMDGKNTVDSDDGILTAYEAMNLNLDETELVVLSACETGLGEIRNGEGVYGLQRAFQTAGAKSVLMSLWKVDDNATQQLMTAFYTNWLKNGDKREAFKKAQASVRAKYKHPYYWGAFVLVGE